MRPHGPLVARRRPRRRRGGARDVRRGDVARPLHRDGRARVQDVADAPRRVVRGVLRVRLRRGARGVPACVRRGRCTRRRGRGSSAAPRSWSRSATSSRSRRAGRLHRHPALTDRRTTAGAHVSGDQTFLAHSSPSPTGSSTGTSDSLPATARPRSRIATVSSSRWAGSATRSCQGVVEGHDAARTEQPQRLGEVLGVLALVAVAEDHVVVTVGEARQDVEPGTGDGAGPAGRDPGSPNVSLASRWCSASMSTVVRTPSARMPRSSHRPETPVPVPISITARASSTEARKRSAAPAPG